MDVFVNVVAASRGPVTSFLLEEGIDEQSLRTAAGVAWEDQEAASFRLPVFNECGFEVPELLASFLRYLGDADLWLDNLLPVSLEVEHAFPGHLPFAVDSTTGQFGLWAEAGDDIESAPMVYFHSEGEPTTGVLAGSLEEFLAILAANPEELLEALSCGDLEELGRVKREPRAPAWLKAFRLWVKAEANRPISTRPGEALLAARGERSELQARLDALLG